MERKEGTFHKEHTCETFHPMFSSFRTYRTASGTVPRVVGMEKAHKLEDASNYTRDELRIVEQLVHRRWTLRILGELVSGPSRFRDLEAALPRISPSVLSARIELLEREGVIHRVLERPTSSTVAYQLTERGECVRGLIAALSEFYRVFYATDGRGRFDPRHDFVLHDQVFDEPA